MVAGLSMSTDVIFFSYKSLFYRYLSLQRSSTKSKNYQRKFLDLKPEVSSKDESHREFVRVGRDGMHANVVLLNSVVNPRDGNIYVLLPNKVIHVLDGQGRRLYSIDLQPWDAKVKDFWPMRISIAEGGEIFSIHPLLGCVRLEIVAQ